MPASVPILQIVLLNVYLDQVALSPYRIMDTEAVIALTSACIAVASVAV
jgi:hypothetical protein